MEMFSDITDVIIAHNLIFVYIDWFFEVVADMLTVSPFFFVVLLIPGLLSRIIRDSI